MRPREKPPLSVPGKDLLWLARGYDWIGSDDVEVSYAILFLTEARVQSLLDLYEKTRGLMGEIEGFETVGVKLPRDAVEWVRPGYAEEEDGMGEMPGETMGGLLSVAAEDGPTLAYGDVRELSSDALYSNPVPGITFDIEDGGIVASIKLGQGETGWVYTDRLLESDLLLAKLSYCPDDEVPALIEKLAEMTPWQTLGVLDDGLGFWGQGDHPLRGVAHLINPTLLEVFLTSPESRVRERAVAVLGKLEPTLIPNAGRKR